MMVLTERNICHYLMDRGFLDPRVIVDGDFLTHQSSSRNYGFKVFRGVDSGLFVKQVRAFDKEKQDSLKLEATIYWLAHNDPNYSLLKTIVPEYHYFDSENHILMMHLIQDAEDLRNYYARTKKFPQEIASELGKILAAYHANFQGKIAEDHSAQLFNQRLPWIFSVDKGDPRWFHPKSREDFELIQLVQNNAEFVDFIEQAKQEWECSCLIHGDIKWANFLVNDNSSDPEVFSLNLIDWEMADIGDPCWDIAGMFQAYLTHWIYTKGYITGFPQGVALEAMLPSIVAFWKSYSCHMGYDEKSADLCLLKSLRYAGIRIIQTCLEMNHDQADFLEDGARMLQLGFNMLKSPISVKEELLGMG